MHRLLFIPLLGLLIPLLAAQETYSLEGRVVSMNQESQTLTLAQEGVPGVLDAGEVKLRLRKADQNMDYVGKIVRGTLRRAGSHWWLDTIWPHDPMAGRIMKDVNRQFRQDTQAAGRRVARMQGDFLPNFALYDETGKVVQMRGFRGKALVINFIFTRCPDPNMCPASTARMARLQRIVKEKGLADVHQISISLDPAYDTPAILNFYAEARGLDTESFSLLTGPEQVIEDVLKTFGILTVDEDGILNHTMATIIVDRNGKIIHRREGSRWSSQAFLDRLETYLQKES